MTHSPILNKMLKVEVPVTVSRKENARLLRENDKIKGALRKIHSGEKELNKRRTQIITTLAELILP